MALLGWAYWSNSGSTESTSGSVKYVVGAPCGPKSRGGVVMVLGGATWTRCARLVREMRAVPTQAIRLVTTRSREMTPDRGPRSALFVMLVSSPRVSFDLPPVPDRRAIQSG